MSEDEEYVQLTHASLAFCKLAAERLREMDIEPRIVEEPQSDFTDLFGANSTYGYTLKVPATKLTQAQTIFQQSVAEQVQENIDAPKDAQPLHRRWSTFGKIAVALALLSILTFGI